MKAYVSYDPYLGVDENHTGFDTVEGNTKEELLQKVLDIYGYGCDPDEENPEELSIDKLIYNIKKNNGCGCDYVLSVITDKGEVLFNV